MASLSAVVSRYLDRLTDAVEKAKGLDPVSDALDSVVRKLNPPPVKEVLSGVALGHPLHPVLVTVPIGAVSGAVYLDVTGGSSSAARRLVGLAVGSSVPAALAGLSDWSDTRDAERRVGLVHLALNVVGVTMLTASWAARGRRPEGVSGRLLTLAGFGVLGTSGWLGGHLSYALGVGVDTTAFQRPAVEWTDAGPESLLEEGRPVCVSVEGTPVMLVRQDGAVCAIADRCTHRGGPLHEGSIGGSGADAYVECPWHGSRFALRDGALVQGPATRPEPAYATRVVDGRVEVRRDEQRSLRLNPVS